VEEMFLNSSRIRHILAGKITATLKNKTLAWKPCNQNKCTSDISEFLIVKFRKISFLLEMKIHRNCDGF